MEWFVGILGGYSLLITYIYVHFIRRWDKRTSLIIRLEEQVRRREVMLVELGLMAREIKEDESNDQLL